MFSPDNAAWSPQIRWLRVLSAYAGVIPAFAAVAVTGADATGVLTVNQPTADGQDVLLNGPLPIALGGTGVCTWDTPNWALYDTGAPAAGDSWGAQANSFLLGKGRAGFAADGPGVGGRALFTRSAACTPTAASVPPCVLTRCVTYVADVQCEDGKLVLTKHYLVWTPCGFIVCPDNCTGLSGSGAGSGGGGGCGCTWTALASGTTSPGADAASYTLTPLTVPASSELTVAVLGNTAGSMTCTFAGSPMAATQTVSLTTGGATYCLTLFTLKVTGSTTGSLVASFSSGTGQICVAAGYVSSLVNYALDGGATGSGASGTPFVSGPPTSLNCDGSVAAFAVAGSQAFTWAGGYSDVADSFVTVAGHSVYLTVGWDTFPAAGSSPMPALVGLGAFAWAGVEEHFT